MKRFASLAVACAVFFGALSASAMPYDDFLAKTAAHLNGKLPLDEFLKICEAELAGDAKGNADYEGQIYADRAIALLRAGKLEEAKAANATALKLRPSSARAAYNIGEIFAAEGKYVEAYEQAMRCASKAKKPELKSVFENKASDYANAGAVTATVLWKAFDENEVAGEDQYKGKLVFVKGKISAINTDVTGQPVVVLDAGKNGFAKVQCVFAKEDRPIIGKLKKGTQILITGTCAGAVMGQVFVKDCKP